MDEYNMKRSLRQCKNATGNGCKMAIQQYRNLNDTLTDASNRTESTLIEINTSSVYVSEATDALSEQLSSTRDSIGLTSSLIEDISTIREDREIFSVTLFGCTMAGKFTLMEVLIDAVRSI